jgi:hypothetical protein
MTKGEQMMEAVLETFEQAYKLHEKGQSETAILITFDIFAAGGHYHPVIAAAHREAIKSAVDACDKRIALPMATAWLRYKLESKLKEQNDGKDKS